MGQTPHLDGLGTEADLLADEPGAYRQSVEPEDYLAGLAGRNTLAGDLARLWQEAVADGMPWSRLQRRAILRLFADHGLLVVHGNDSALHAAAASFYEQLWEQRDQLRDAARRGGRQLTAAGFAAAVTEPSIQRFLHLGREGHRQPLAAEHAGVLPAAATLRPGVVARSLVQDWLFRPAGVVVGPGEVAYLKQLAPAYEAFGLPRAPLLPRLFAQLGPAGRGAFTAWAMHLADREPEPGEDKLEAAAQREAVDRADDRNRALLDRVAHRLAARGDVLRFDRGQFRELRDVRPGDEGLLSRSGQDHDAHIITRGDFLKQPGQVTNKLRVHGIVHLRSV